MPEELNRIILDHISTLLLAADETAERNLLAEGLPPERIRMVGSSVSMRSNATGSMPAAQPSCNVWR
jgi:UDP-N-acetylglucosamine 2-epimerase